ncbi:unnamed protein product, partial [Discosporangium mesarthrocarpum]
VQEAFDPGSPFWSEHGYNSETGTPGYFSYVHSLEGAPGTSIEQARCQPCCRGEDVGKKKQVIHHVRNLAVQEFPEVSEARYAEWWAHCRPHSSGHQLHFDSDNEGKGGVRNPIVSTVVYVTGDIGGPTLVTTQRLNSTRLAERGWIVHPKENRLCIFDGGVLHGVIPGRGVPPPSSNAIGSPGVVEQGQGQGQGQRQRRVTWMVAFWRDIKARPRKDGLPGAAQPFPQLPPPPSSTEAGMSRGITGPLPPCGAGEPWSPQGQGKGKLRGATRGIDDGSTKPTRQDPMPATKRTWPSLFAKKPQGWSTKDRDDSRGTGPAPVLPVPVIWQDVDRGENERRGWGVQGLKKLPGYDLCFQGF